jgi:5'-methylthioadenosine/S-adenosylhomocysteine nucleosidase
MIGIVCAMHEEASYLIKKYKLKQVCGKPFKIYQNQDITLIISLIGKVNAAAATVELIDLYKPKYIVNIGLAGGLNKELEIGQTVIISKVIQHDIQIPDQFCPSYYKESIDCFIIPESGSNFREAILLTGDQFINDKNVLSHLALIGDVVEMEGYSVARIAKLYDIPCIILKIISDDGSDDAMQKFESNFDTVMKQSIEGIALALNNLL